MAIMTTDIDVDVIRKNTLSCSTALATHILGLRYDVLHCATLSTRADLADATQHLMPFVMRYLAQDTSLDIEDRVETLGLVQSSYVGHSLTADQKEHHVQALQDNPLFRASEKNIRTAVKSALNRAHTPEDWDGFFKALANGAFTPESYGRPAFVGDVAQIFVADLDIKLNVYDKLKSASDRQKDALLFEARTAMTVDLLKAAGSAITTKDFHLAMIGQHAHAILDKALTLCQHLHNSEAELFQTSTVGLTRPTLSSEPSTVSEKPLARQPHRL